MKGWAITAIASILILGTLGLSQDAFAGHFFITMEPNGRDCIIFGNWDAGTLTCTLTTDVFTDSGVGIKIGEGGITLDGNGHLITPTTVGDIGIQSFGTGTTIKNVIVEDFTDGIDIQRNNNVISGVTVSNNDRNGIVVSFNIDGTEIIENEIIQNGLVSGFGNGIQLQGFNEGVKINGNIITSNVGGIKTFFGTNNMEIVGNIISENMFGIALLFSDNNIIKENTITSNTFGIGINSDNNQIFNNNFLNNNIQVQIDDAQASGNVFNLSPPTGGNYWSNFDTPVEGCNNTNNDSFCDEPFIIPSVAQDNLPWTIQNGWNSPEPSDTTPPTITLIGDAEVTILVGESYNDEGATALDDVDGDITSKIITVNTVDTSTPGAYLVTYDVTDAAGNAATQVTRTVIVQTPQEATSTIIEDVQDLVESGDLNNGQGNSLTSKLQNIISKYDDGKENSACNQLGAFANEVQALINSGTLSQEQGETLLDSANNILTNAC